jgi:hypothetical protein
MAVAVDIVVLLSHVWRGALPDQCKRNLRAGARTADRSRLAMPPVALAVLVHPVERGVDLLV